MVARLAKPRAVIVLGIALYLGLTLLRLFTQQPWNDEAYHATPALNLLRHGHMGTSNIEGKTLYFQGINEHTYWNVPVYYLIGAVWYKLVGFDLFRARLLSLVLATIGLLAFGYVVRRLTGSQWTAAAAVVLTGTTFAFIRSASENRLETPALAFGMLAIASYLHWRERNFVRAVIISQTLAALSGLSHPMGILYFCGLAVIVIALDRRRITPKAVLLGSIPYIAGGILWGMYILQAPQDFRVQFFGNIQYHEGASVTRDPIGALAEEVRNRYLNYFGVAGKLSHPLKQLRGLQLVAYLIAFVVLLTIPAIRKAPGVKIIAAVTITVMTVLFFVDGGRKATYLVHVLPWLSAGIAIVMVQLVARRLVNGWIAAALAFFLVGLQASGILFIVRQRSLQTAYYPVTEYLRTHAGQTTIFGSSELGFVIGFDRPLIDDIALGLHSGKKAGMIVVDRNWETAYGNRGGKIGRGHIRNTLEPCRIVFHNSGYKVFDCKNVRQVAASTRKTE
jgi:4-amino-4-deoxy-L-arabinose transferase-like glycosyltransferase